MSRLCPHCQRPLNSSLPMEVINELDALELQRKQRAVLDALVSSYPRFVTAADLEQWMWDDVGEAIPKSDTAISSHVSKLRKTLQKLGFGIEAKRFVGLRLTIKSTKR
ncbi:helix-turn-helix domain-containing protein [Agrobacterium radiobacter]